MNLYNPLWCNLCIKKKKPSVFSSPQSSLNTYLSLISIYHCAKSSGAALSLAALDMRQKRLAPAAVKSITACEERAGLRCAVCVNGHTELCLRSSPHECRQSKHLLGGIWKWGGARSAFYIQVILRFIFMEWKNIYNRSWVTKVWISWKPKG